MTAPTTDELRAVTISLLDKCGQIERLLQPHYFLDGVPDCLANVRAYRTSLRGYLGRIRDIERAGAGAEPPPPEALATTPHTSNDQTRDGTQGPAPARFQNSENSYQATRE